ncbi:MAG: cupin domain-containing protein [Solirubrobacterales bacterium]
MESRPVDLAAQSLEPEAPGIASRALDVNGVRWALVEYEPGVLREEWCEVGHSGYVLAGEVVYEFEAGGEPLALGAGDAFTLADGEAHRGRAGPQGARLFLIDRAG